MKKGKKVNNKNKNLAYFVFLLFAAIVFLFLYDPKQPKISPVTRKNEDVPAAQKAKVTPITEKTDEKCPTSLSGNYTEAISLPNGLCKFTYFDSYNTADFSITYPQTWTVDVVGAAGTNLNLETPNKDAVLIINMITDLPVESIHKTEYCYDYCVPIIKKEETIFSKSIKNVSGVKIMEVTSKIQDKTVTRLFYKTNSKDNGMYRLYIFETNSTSKDFKNKLLEIASSIVVLAK